ncbi:MAG: PTS sugar transporter subunit IIC [Clostridia bacterium]|nr:PTS sugar transporter subunit IIC [Clostridia bacterium]
MAKAGGVLKKAAKRYFVDAMGAMAQGLFCSLLIGTIIKTVGDLSGVAFITEIGGFAVKMAGPAMAVAIGYALGADPLVLFSLTAVGASANELGGAGGPLAVLIIAIVAAELGRLVSKKTKIDILLTPLVTIASGVGLAALIAKPIGTAASWIGNAIMWATDLQPFFMGIVVSVLVGVALTLPISSAAICAALGLTGLAGGAAVAGCCAQMVGFAVMSFRENKWGGLISQGVGTSMLQMGNIVKNPRIWLPPILTSAITGPLATCVFRMTMNGTPVSAGMGTCGFVGQIGVITGWYNPSEAAVAAGAAPVAPGVFEWVGFALICFILPAVLTWAFGLVLRKIGWIKKDDLKLSGLSRA